MWRCPGTHTPAKQAAQAHAVLGHTCSPGHLTSLPTSSPKGKATGHAHANETLLVPQNVLGTAKESPTSLGPPRWVPTTTEAILRGVAGTLYWAQVATSWHRIPGHTHPLRVVGANTRSHLSRSKMMDVRSTIMFPETPAGRFSPWLALGTSHPMEGPRCQERRVL